VRPALFFAFALAARFASAVAPGPLVVLALDAFVARALLGPAAPLAAPAALARSVPLAISAALACAAPSPDAVVIVSSPWCVRSRGGVLRPPCRAATAGFPRARRGAGPRVAPPGRGAAGLTPARRRA
jgi:hypothetical protein